MPEELWAKHQTDVGKVRPAGAVKIQFRLGAPLARQIQYLLSQTTINRIRPTIYGLKEAGVLVETRSPSNTLIFPVQKQNSEKWFMI